MFDDNNEEDWADPPVGEVAAAKDPPETMKSVSKAGGGESSDGITRETREAVMEVAVKESNTKNDHDHSSTGNGGKSSKDDGMSSRSEHSEYIYVTKVLPSDK